MVQYGQSKLHFESIDFFFFLFSNSLICLIFSLIFGNFCALKSFISSILRLKISFDNNNLLNFISVKPFNFSFHQKKILASPKLSHFNISFSAKYRIKIEALYKVISPNNNKESITGK